MALTSQGLSNLRAMARAEGWACVFDATSLDGQRAVMRLPADDARALLEEAARQPSQPGQFWSWMES